MEEAKTYKLGERKIKCTETQAIQIKKEIEKLIKKILNPPPIEKKGDEYKIEFITFLLNFIDNMGIYQVKKLKNDNRFAVSIKYLNELFTKKTNIISMNAPNKIIYLFLGFTPYTYTINKKSTRGYKFEPDITYERLNKLLENLEKNIE